MRRLRAIMMTGALIACTALPAPAQSPPALTTIRVGAGLDVESTPLIYAVKAGLFQQVGLNVEVVKLNGGGAAIAAAVVSGALEFGKASLVTIISAHVRGVPLALIAPAASYAVESPDIPLIVAANSPIKTAKDLSDAGSTVGVTSLSTTGLLACKDWIDRNGGDSSKVKFVELSQTAVAPAIDAGRIVGYPLSDPALGVAMATGKYRVLGYPYNAIAKKFELADWFVNPAYVAEHRDIAEKFAAVMAKANVYVATHEVEMQPLIAAYVGLDPSEVLKMKEPGRAAYLQPALIQPVIDDAVKYKIIPATFPASDLISDAALKPPK